MSKLSAYTLHVKSHPAYGPRSSYYRMLAAVDRGNYARAAAVILSTPCAVDAYPCAAALAALAYSAYSGPVEKGGVEWRAAVSLLGGAAITPRSAKASVQSLAAYAAELAGEAAYGDY